MLNLRERNWLIIVHICNVIGWLLCAAFVEPTLVNYMIACILLAAHSALCLATLPAKEPTHDRS